MAAEDMFSELGIVKMAAEGNFSELGIVKMAVEDMFSELGIVKMAVEDMFSELCILKKTRIPDDEPLSQTDLTRWRVGSVYTSLSAPWAPC